jgi:ankyrin repeat protein
MPLLLLVVLVLDGLFLLVALWGSRSSPPGDNAVAAGLAAIAAIVTAVPLVVAIGFWLAGLPRLATAAALVPALAVAGKTDAVDALLRAGARPDVTDDEGTPVIFHSLKLEDPRMFRLLLEHGADISGHDGRAYSLLMAAAWHRRWPEAVLLLERGLDPAVVNVRGDSVKTILDEGDVDEATLADPGYQTLIARLGERGVRVHRSASKAS